MFERPHTSANYLMKEKGFRIARKHAAKLRRYTHFFGFGLPLALTLAAILAETAGVRLLSVIAAFSVTLGIGIERWLFFAEAKQVVTLYYGARSA